MLWNMNEYNLLKEFYYLSLLGGVSVSLTFDGAMIIRACTIWNYYGEIGCQAHTLVYAQPLTFKFYSIKALEINKYVQVYIL